MDRNELHEISQMLVDFLVEVESDIGEVRKNLQESIEGEVLNEKKKTNHLAKIWTCQSHRKRTLWNKSFLKKGFIGYLSNL